MEAASFSEVSSGRVSIADGGAAFVPSGLPPKLEPTLALMTLLGEAERELGRLAGAAGRLLNPHLVAGPLLRREAIVSSRIEGTVATPQDVLVLEAADAVVPPLASGLDSTREVLNYVRALEHGMARLAELPLCVRLFCDLHKVLLDGVRLVPPPPSEMRGALEDLEKYLNEEPSTSSLPLLVKAALAHYQFEAIHPFRDGNGRVGRLLITLSLVAWGLIRDPLLYMSSYFEQRRGEYGDRMLAVSTAGDWDGWIRFFLVGVAESARVGLRQTERLLELRERYQAQVQSARASALLPKLVDHLFRRPSVTIADAARALDVTFASASASVRRLVEAGILAEATGRKRDQVFVAPEIMRFIGEG